MPKIPRYADAATKAATARATVTKRRQQQQLTDHPAPSEEVEVWISIDPGEVHCGVALFEDGICVDAWEMAPHACIAWVRKMLLARCVNVLLVEQFRLYPWMAEQQSFSQMLTVEVIGVLRYLWATLGCRSADESVLRQTREGGGRTIRGIKTLEWVTWVENPATVKEPCEQICKARKIELVSVREARGGHAKDAEIHGQYFKMHQAGQVPTYAVGRGGNPAEVIIIERPGAAPKTAKRAAVKVKPDASPAGKQVAKRRAAKKVDKMSARTAAQILGKKDPK